jgi:hypothetical protein
MTASQVRTDATVGETDRQRRITTGHEAIDSVKVARVAGTSTGALT